MQRPLVPAEWTDAVGHRPPWPDAGMAHAWCFDLDHPDGSDPRAWGPLSDDEQARAARFRFPQHAHRHRVAHLRLRQLLGRLLDLDPRCLRFSAGPHGRPHLDGLPRDLRFNLAHSDDLGLIGWSVQADIGVDIERPRPSGDLVSLAAQHYRPEEAAQVSALGDAAFFACWTRKEAVLKACGTGLLTPLADIAVGASPDRVPAVSVRPGSPLPSTWSLHAGEGPLGSVVAVALPREGVGLRVWRGVWREEAA